MKLLLIEDDPEHADLIRSHIGRKDGSWVKVTWARTLKDGLDHLRQSPFEVILLDLGLPDSSVDRTLGAVLPEANGIPVVVLSCLEDEDFAIKAVHQGAQDYVCKSQLNGELLFRTIRYSIERKAVEEKLRMANQTKDEFLATLSHELRTPVSVIHGYVELLRQRYMSEAEKQQALETIFRNSKLQVSLIDDLLDMSRIITGKLALHSQALELEPIVHAAMESIRLAAQAKQIALETLWESPIGMIQGDPVRIQQILWNLLSNAIKFTPTRGWIEVRVKRVQSQVEIEVQDSGEGIDPSFLPYVFDRFRQQDSSMRRHVGGLGLGLSIVRYLVELHGGRINVASGGLGKGATFTISIPLMAVRIGTADVLCQGTGPLSKEAPSNEKVPLAPELALKGIHVLAVDDSPDTLMLVGMLLRKSGAAVSSARSSVEALDMLKTLRPDVIVCDIGMPDEDGYSFLRKFRAIESATGQRHHIPAAALTALARDEDRQESVRAGFQIHLVKPVEERALVRAMGTLAGNAQAFEAR